MRQMAPKVSRLTSRSRNRTRHLRSRRPIARGSNLTSGCETRIQRPSSTRSLEASSSYNAAHDHLGQ